VLEVHRARRQDEDLRSGRPVLDQYLLAGRIRADPRGRRDGVQLIRLELVERRLVSQELGEVAGGLAQESGTR
jgi:hypothetical protein